MSPSQEVTEPAVLLPAQLLGSEDDSGPASKIFSKEILRHQAAFPSISLMGFILCFEHRWLSRGKTEGLGDSKWIRDEIKAKQVLFSA